VVRINQRLNPKDSARSHLILAIEETTSIQAAVTGPNNQLFWGVEPDLGDLRPKHTHGGRFSDPTYWGSMIRLLARPLLPRTLPVPTANVFFSTFVRAGSPLPGIKGPNSAFESHPHT
jgi:hypothetical protein